MYWAFIQRSFSGSNTDGEAPTFSSGELALHLLARQDLAVAAGRPAEQGQEVDQRLGEDARVPPLLDGRRSVSLGELLLVRAQDHAEVGELRYRRAEGSEQRHVLGRVGEVVVAPDHVRDAHVRVVDADAEVVERVPVGPDEHEVVEGVGRKLHAPSDQVVDDDRLGRHLQADDVALARGRPAVALFERNVPAAPE